MSAAGCHCFDLSHCSYLFSILKCIIPFKSSQLKPIQIQYCLFDRDKHFQDVVIFGSIQIENNQIEKSSMKALTAWLLSKLHVIRELKYRLKVIIQTEHFRESNYKHCETAMLIEKIKPLFWIATFGVVGQRITIWLATKN